MSGPPDPRLRAAHDLNNVLAAIIARAEVVLGMKRTGAAVRAELEEIRRRAVEGAGLVRRFLGQAGAEANPTPVALAALLADWAGELRRVLGPDRRLDLEVLERPMIARADADALRRVLRDLALNARDATSPGGKVSLRLGRVRLDHARPGVPDSVPPGAWAVIEVSDDGAGIAPDLLPRVFEPFFTTKASARGSGIGLASARASLHEMGGAVTIESVPGSGTTLRLHLPLVDTATGTVLLVEDEPALRRLASQALRQAGWRVAEAESAEAALARHGTAPFDLVVADVTLPGMDGPALLGVLRRERPDLPAILISGYAAHSLAAGPETRYLVKPYRPAALLDLVAQALKNNLRTDD